MSASRTGSRLRRHLTWSGALILVLAAGFLLVSARAHPGAAGPDLTSVVKIEDAGFLYTYHVPTDTEGLFDLRDDPRCLRNLVAERRPVAARMRRLLERRLGLHSLRDLFDPEDPAVRTLRGHGYL